MAEHEFRLSPTSLQHTIAVVMSTDNKTTAWLTIDGAPVVSLNTSGHVYVDGPSIKRYLEQFSVGVTDLPGQLTITGPRI